MVLEKYQRLTDKQKYLLRKAGRAQWFIAVSPARAREGSGTAQLVNKPGEETGQVPVAPAPKQPTSSPKN